MKTKNYLLLLIAIFILNACKKEAVTRPVKFTSTTYQTLGTYDSLGKPNYLVLRDTVSPSLLSFLNNILPSRENLTITHPELFSSTAIGDITITQSSDVFVTFVLEGCGYANALAFYTYPTNQSPTSANDIKLITYIFPSCGNKTPLHSGDKVKIGRFNVGTSIGFVLMQRAWDTTAHVLNNDVVHFCTNDALNPEVNPDLKKHAVLINYAPENKVIIGFEDVDRTSANSDSDFNDVVVYCTVTP
jgi:hypothetical protein